MQFVGIVVSDSLTCIIYIASFDGLSLVLCPVVADHKTFRLSCCHLGVANY